MFVPRVRGSFSDRNNIKKINEMIQIDSFDNRTRTLIMNLLDDIFDKRLNHSIYGEQFYNYLYKEVFVTTKDDVPIFYLGFYDNAREPIYSGIIKDWDYDSILSFLEVVIEWLKKYCGYDASNQFNILFKKEFVGYRFIEGFATRITSDEEIKTIEKTLNSKYSTCSTCIKKATQLLFDRKKPDYENSIKESISAVEAICNIINGGKRTTLNKAVEKLKDSGITIHPAMKESFISLYGYTSDQSGIRHNTGIDGKATYGEAKYMLVSCSAFVNYLIELNEQVVANIN